MATIELTKLQWRQDWQVPHDDGPGWNEWISIARNQEYRIIPFNGQFDLVTPRELTKRFNSLQEAQDFAQTDWEDWQQTIRPIEYWTSGSIGFWESKPESRFRIVVQQDGMFRVQDFWEKGYKTLAEFETLKEAKAFCVERNV